MEQKKQKSSIIIATVEALIAVFMILVVKSTAPVCAGMLEVTGGKQVHMKCYYAGVVIVFLAVLLLINAILCFVSKQKMVCGIMAIAISIFVFAALNDNLGIGICMKAEMACHATAAYAKVCATLEIIAGIISIVLAGKEKNA